MDLKKWNFRVVFASISQNTNMGKIKLLHNHKLTFVYIPVKLEYCGNVKKNRYRNFAAFLVKSENFGQFFASISENTNLGKIKLFYNHKLSFFDIPDKF